MALKDNYYSKRTGKFLGEFEIPETLTELAVLGL